MANPLTATLELVLRAQDGDEQALESLFGRYYDRVRRVVRVRIGPGLRSQLETGDVLQQTFMTAVRLFDRFEMRDEGSLIHWLSMLAERQIHDQADYSKADKRNYQRKVRLEIKGEDGATTDLGRDLRADDLLPEQHSAKAEEQRQLEEAMDQLDEPHRAVILLRDFEGLSWEDVATELGRPSAGAARMFHATALKNLALLMRRGMEG